MDNHTQLQAQVCKFLVFSLSSSHKLVGIIIATTSLSNGAVLSPLGSLVASHASFPGLVNKNLWERALGKIAPDRATIVAAKKVVETSRGIKKIPRGQSSHTCESCQRNDTRNVDKYGKHFCYRNKVGLFLTLGFYFFNKQSYQDCRNWTDDFYASKLRNRNEEQQEEDEEEEEEEEEVVPDKTAQVLKAAKKKIANMTDAEKNTHAQRISKLAAAAERNAKLAALVIERNKQQENEMDEDDDDEEDDVQEEPRRKGKKGLPTERRIKK